MGFGGQAGGERVSFTTFVGLNLFPSAFTTACPAMALFMKFGLRYCVPAGDLT
jgi:hypothetical protein